MTFGLTTLFCLANLLDKLALFCDAMARINIFCKCRIYLRVIFYKQNLIGIPAVV